MDEKLQAAFNDQIALEQASAHAYLQLSVWAESRDMTGMARWFGAQATEERDHAQLFINHVLDRDGEVALQSLAAPEHEFDDTEAAFAAALRHEETVTASIGELYGLAQQVGDYRSLPLLTRFLDEQVEEEAAVRTILGELRLTGGDPSALFMLDRELPGRRRSGDEAG